MRKLTKLAIRSIGLLCSFVIAVDASAQSDIFLGDIETGGVLQIFGIDTTGEGDNVLDAELNVDGDLNIELSSTQASAGINENALYNFETDVLQVKALTVGAFTYWADFPLVGLEPTRFAVGSNGFANDMCHHKDWVIHWNTGGLPASDLEIFCEPPGPIDPLSLPPGAQAMPEPDDFEDFIDDFIYEALLDSLYECEVRTGAKGRGRGARSVTWIDCGGGLTFWRYGYVRENSRRFHRWLRRIADDFPGAEIPAPYQAVTLPVVDPRALRCILGGEVQHFGFTGDEGKICPKDKGPTLLLGNDDRFTVETTFTDSESNTGPGTAGRITLDSGDFWFGHPEVSDVVVKVFDGCDLPGFNHFFVFAEGFTDLAVEITVTDTDTAETKVYNNPLGTPFEAITDTEAFACP